MSLLIPHLLIIHSVDLGERIASEAAAVHQSKSKTARAAIESGLPRVLEMSRAEILSRSQNSVRLTELPRESVWLHRQTEKIVADFALDLKIPKWKIYSLAIETGLEIWLQSSPDTSTPNA